MLPQHASLSSDDLVKILQYTENSGEDRRSAYLWNLFRQYHIGEHSLEEINEINGTYLASIDGSYGEIAARMQFFQDMYEEIIKTGDKIWGDEVTFEDGGVEYVVSGDVPHCKASCPFVCEHNEPLINYLVRNPTANIIMVVNTLTKHLAEEHDFLEAPFIFGDRNIYGLTTQHFYEGLFPQAIKPKL